MTVESFDELLAERTLTQVAEAFAKLYRPKGDDKARDARSLLQEIRKLRDGDKKWFTKRPEAARLLAKVIGCTVTELGLAMDEALVPFPDFPAATPLDLSDPNDPPFMADAWMPLLQAAEENAVWFSSAPGTGKTTFSRWLEARGRATRIETPTLAAAEREIVAATAGALVVDLARLDASDVAVLQRVTRRGLVILAPGARPQPIGEPDRQPGGSTRPPPASNWLDLEWNPAAFERRGFLDWLLRRAGDDAPHAERTWRKMAEFDPDAVLLTTPDDVVQFVGALHENPRAATDGVIRRAAASLGSEWLAAHGSELFRQLAVARWNDLRFPLGEPIAATVWMEYVPQKLVAPADRSALLAELQALRSDKADTAAIADRLQRDPAMTIRLLESSRLLAATPDGRLVLRPRWLAQAVIHDHLAALLKVEPAAACHVAVDATRRAVLDRSAVNLDDAAFNAFVKKCLSVLGRDDLGAIGAVELAFAAVARRHSAKKNVGVPRLLPELVRRQLDALVERFNGLPRAPVTRPGAGAPGGDGFLADCWQWSLLSPQPKGASYDPWLFPGWGDPPDEIPNWLHGGHAASGSHDDAERLRVGARALLSRWPAKAWTHMPSWMLPIALTMPVEWPISDEDARRLHADEVARALRSAVDDAAADLRALILRRIWSRMTRWELYDVIRFLEGPMGDPLLAAADVDVLAAGAATWAPKAHGHELHRVPPLLRGPIVRWLLANTRDRVEDDLRRQVDHLGADEADCLLQLAEGRTGWLAVHRLWQVAPDCARNELTRRITARDDGAAHWLEAPTSATSMILDVVGTYPAPIPGWLRRWAARRMLDAPTVAERLLPFARS